MRIVIATAALAGAAIASAAVALTPHRAHAQTLDRYGGSTAAYAPSAAAPAPYPQPAYAAAATQPAPYPAAAYASGPYTPASYAPQSAAVAGLRMLTWPGKDAPVAPPPPGWAPPAQAYAPAIRFAPAPPASPYVPAAATLPSSGGVQPPTTVLRPVQVQPAGPTGAPGVYGLVSAAARTPAPTSIYSDAPAAAPPGPSAQARFQGEGPGRAAQQAAPRAQVAAQAQPLTPGQMADRLPPPDQTRSRLYSLHREYGMTPDPAPIPPVFFGATADLSAPETPDVPPHTGATASKAAQNAARLAAEANTP